MIKRSQYVQLTLLILLVFVLFLLTAASISYQDSSISAGEGAGYSADGAQSSAGADTEENQTVTGKEEVVVIEGDNTVGAENIEKELVLLKKRYLSYKTMEEVPGSVKKNMKVLIFCSSTAKGYYSYDDVTGAAEEGTDIIFAVMPSESMQENWAALMGIRFIGDRYTQKGVIALGSFMVGGLRWYEDYRVRTRRVKVDATSKTYLAGMLASSQKDVLRNEDATDIIWRTVYKKGRIIVVNGSFFTDENHIGILNAVFSKLNSDYVYPIINAKMLFVENAPYLSNENDEEMQARYARSSERFLEEIAIPGIISLAMELEIQPQFYGTRYLKNAASGIKSDSVDFLYRELGKIGGNIQVSAYMDQLSRVTKSIDVFENAMGQDVTSLLFQANNTRMERQIVSALDYAGHITSIVHKWDFYPYMKTDENGRVYIPMMTEGFTIDDELLVWFDEAAASIGLITHGIPMEDIIYPPQNEDEDWATIFKDFGSYYYTACRKYEYLDGVDAQGLEQRVRNYLAMEPQISYGKKKIQIKVENLNGAGYFILQTEKEIRKMSSGSFEDIGDDAYLLTITDPETEITLKEVVR